MQMHRDEVGSVDAGKCEVIAKSSARSRERKPTFCFRRRDLFFDVTSSSNLLI